MEALRRVVEVLEVDRAAWSAARRTSPVIVGQPGRIRVGAGVDQASLLLADGTEIDLAIGDEHVSVDDPLPVGCHTLALDVAGGDERATVVVAPDRMPATSSLAGKAAVFVPAYALWEHESPLPSYGNLAALAAALPSRGIDVLMTLPLYAAFLGEPFDPSPYAPVSRLHWNEVYLDDEGLPEAPIPGIGDLVDFGELGARRRRQLLDAVAGLDPATATAIDRFVAATPDVAEYAAFRAKVSPDPADAGRPAELVAASHRLAQYLAHEELLGMHGDGSATIALDLPIGSHPLGFETWAYPDLFATGMAIGAPPDTMFVDGQNWGFPPQLPGAAERRRFDLWRRVVARVGNYASLLRIDHVLGVHRLWWIPDGMSPMDGVYVGYPRQMLLSVIAAEAATAGMTVVGEDLGTVPAEIIEAMAEWSMLGLFEEAFVVDEPDLPPIPERTVAGIRTHDMEPFAVLHDRGELTTYGKALARALRHSVGSGYDELLGGTLERLATSPAYLVVADLDDLLSERTPHNIPGKVLPTIWRRRLRQPTSATLADRRVAGALRVLGSRT